VVVAVVPIAVRRCSVLFPPLRSAAQRYISLALATCLPPPAAGPHPPAPDEASALAVGERHTAPHIHATATPAELVALVALHTSHLRTPDDVDDVLPQAREAHGARHRV
jgi:hypothetical protein